MPTSTNNAMHQTDCRPPSSCPAFHPSPCFHNRLSNHFPASHTSSPHHTGSWPVLDSIVYWQSATAQTTHPRHMHCVLAIEHCTGYTRSTLLLSQWQTSDDGITVADVGAASSCLPPPSTAGSQVHMLCLQPLLSPRHPAGNHTHCRACHGCCSSSRA